MDYYEYNPEELNYDGASHDFGERCVMIPAYADNGLSVKIQISCDFPGRSGLPSREEDVTGTIDEVYEDFGRVIHYYDLHKWAELSREDYTGVKKAYEAVKRTGASIKKIMQSDYDRSDDYDGSCHEDLYIITVEEACGGYIYSCTKDKLYTFEEYMYAKKLEYNATSEPSFTPTPTLTRTSFWTPRPSGTASISAPNTQTIAAPTLSKTATVTPSAGRTAAPALTATVSLLPSPSSAPGQSAGEKVLIALGIVLACAVLGAAVFASIKNWKVKP